jgi:biotin carboxylase
VLGCADILLPVYQKLCERTGKYCYATAEQVSIFGNKKGLKGMLKKYGLPYIPEYQFATIGDCNLISDDEFPVFVKPVDNCSSKGMSVCYTRDDFQSCYNKAMDASRSHTILVEQYMVCDDISVTYTFVSGRVYVTSISDRYVNREQKGVGTITTALVYPSKYTELYFETIHEKACRLFEDLKIENGILTIQAFAKDNKIMFYDPAFRVTGGQGYIFFDYFGKVDQIKMLIEFSITGNMMGNGEEIDSSCNFGKNWATNLVILAKTGTIGSIEGFDKIKDYPGVLNVTQSHFEGDEIRGRGTLDQTVARIHLVADDKEKLQELINRVLDTITVTDVKGENMLLKQFEPSILSTAY